MQKLIKEFEWVIFFTLCLGTVPDAGLRRLFLGWLSFIENIYPRIEFNIPLIAEGVFCLILSIVTINTTGFYLITRQWKWRWSIMTVIFTSLLFIIALASIGLVKIYLHYLQVT